MSKPVIGIDVHCIGQRQTGNETYIRNLVEQFSTMSLPWDFLFYHTLPEREFNSSRWRGALRRVRPTRVVAEQTVQVYARALSSQK